MKQSPALWYGKLSRTLIDLELKPIFGIECVYTNTYMIVFFSVDDICVLYDKRHTAQVDAFEASLFTTYEMKSLGGIEWFLGIRVSRNRPSLQLWLCLDRYIGKPAAKFKISGDKAKASPLPVEDLTKFLGTAPAQDVLQFQQKVGSINFAA